MKLVKYSFFKLYLVKLNVTKSHISFIDQFMIDFTYLLEKLKVQKFVKLFLKKFNYFKIQENIFYKYILCLNKQYLYSQFTHKYKSLINLHHYLSNFPIFLYDVLVTNKIFLYELKTQIQYMKNLSKNSYNLNLIKTPILNNLKSIESIFELYVSKTKIVTISPTNSIILNCNKNQKSFYYLELPLQNLLHNLNMTILPTATEHALISLKNFSTLIIGGESLYVGRFSPSLVALYYYNTLTYSTNLYISLKNTTIYIYNLILESLLKQYRSQGILLPSFLFELIIKRMVSYVRILKSGNTCLLYKDIVPGTLVNLINQSFILNGLVGSLYTPVIIGISKLSLSCSGLLASLSFQETLKSLSKSVLDNKIDWILDLKAKIIMSDLIDTGTGWYKHYNI